MTGNGHRWSVKCAKGRMSVIVVSPLVTVAPNMAYKSMAALCGDRQLQAAVVRPWATAEHIKWHQLLHSGRSSIHKRGFRLRGWT
jgi:hypothetical protein